MPKAQTQLTETQFADALKRAGITEQPKRLLVGRTFTIKAKGAVVTDVPANYVGFGIKARIDLEATLKRLKKLKSVLRGARKPRAPKQREMFTEKSADAFTGKTIDPSKGLQVQGFGEPEPVARMVDAST